MWLVVDASKKNLFIHVWYHSRVFLFLVRLSETVLHTVRGNAQVRILAIACAKTNWNIESVTSAVPSAIPLVPFRFHLRWERKWFLLQARDPERRTKLALSTNRSHFSRCEAFVICPLSFVVILWFKIRHVLRNMSSFLDHPDVS